MMSVKMPYNTVIILNIKLNHHDDDDLHGFHDFQLTSLIIKAILT